MEVAAMDKLVDKGEFRPAVAQAIAEAIEITIKAGNFVTTSVLDARFAASEVKMEARFSSLEKSIESTKVWATCLYAGLVIALFSALAVDHHWLVTREDQLISQLETRADARFAEAQAHADQQQARWDQQQARWDQRFEEMQARSDQRFQQAEAQVDVKLDQIRALILSTPSREGSVTRPPASGARARRQ
jgi:hypothetical protein